MSFAFPPFARPSLAALLAAGDRTPTRVLCTGGVVWSAAGAGRWRPEAGSVAEAGPVAAGGGSGRETHDDARPSLDVDAADRWLAAHALRPVALASPDGLHGERFTLLSAVGALGWRPPLEALGAGGAGGVAGGMPRVALQLRPLVDAAEQHALDAVTRYAAAAGAAARVARLLDVPTLETISVTPGLFVAVDALASAGLRTLAAAESLAARAFGRGLLGAPPTLRATLLEVRLLHAAPAAARRRALRRHAGEALGMPTVRVQRLRVDAGIAWSVRVPVGRAPTDAVAGVGTAKMREAPAAGTDDAFEAAWSLATECWRALTLVIYATAGAWAFD